MTDTVIICGMPSERDILAAAYPGNLILSGADKLNLSSLVPPTCNRIVSMGLCGGLHPALKIAHIAVADNVVDGLGNEWVCDTKWNAALLQIAFESVPNAWAEALLVCPWYSSGVMDQADTVIDRSALFKATGTWAIDDESYYAAKFCAEHKLYFNVARSVSDDAGETLPLAARGAIMTASGSVNFQYLLKEIVSEPILQTLDLVKIAADYNNSLDTLRDLAQGVKLP